LPNVERVCVSIGMHAGAPQDFVGEHVPEAGDNGLVHEDRLDRAMPPPQGSPEVGGCQVEGVGTLGADDRTHRFRRMGEPNAPELPLVAVAELPDTGDEYDASVEMTMVPPW
jgi:hypothetical protein